MVRRNVSEVVGADGVGIAVGGVFYWLMKADFNERERPDKSLICYMELTNLPLKRSIVVHFQPSISSSQPPTPRGPHYVLSPLPITLAGQNRVYLPYELPSALPLHIVYTALLFSALLFSSTFVS